MTNLRLMCVPEIELDQAAQLLRGGPAVRDTPVRPFGCFLLGGLDVLGAFRGTR